MRKGEPLNVKLGIAIKKVNFNIHSSTLTMDIWLRMKWLDERLLYDPVPMFGSSWDPHDYLPISMMTGDDTNLWVPDVNCVNATDSIDGMIMSHAYVNHNLSPGFLNDTDGVPFNVFLSRPGRISVHCSPQLSNFPFDTPSCALDFQSWGFSNEYFRIVNMSEGWQESGDMPLSMDYKFDDEGPFAWDEVGELQRQRHDVEDSSACDMSFSNYRVTMKLRRLPSYHITHSVAPLSMVVFLSALTFWLPINNNSSGSGERLSYTVMLVLTIITVMLFTAEKKPAVPETTWMDKWQTRSLLLSVVPVIETAALFWFQNVLQMHAHEDDEPMAMCKTKSVAKQDQKKSLNREAGKLLNAVIGRCHTWTPPWLFRFLGPVAPENIDTWFRILFPGFIVITFERLPMRILNIISEKGFVHGTQLFAGVVLFLGILSLPSLYLLVSRICYASSADCCSCGHHSDGGSLSDSDRENSF